MRHPVTLLAIAPAIGQHMVVAEINRVLGLRNEMIDVPAVTPDASWAVEASPALQVHQYRPDRPKRIPFRAE